MTSARARLPALVLSLLPALGPPAECRPPAARPTPSGSSVQSPFEIRLELTADTALRAVLRNRSASPQRYLLDNALQPSRLELDGPSGMIPEEDGRAAEKFDPEARRHQFRELAPGDEVVVETARFDRTPHGYTLQWGPFRYGPFAPGAYTAQVVWSASAGGWTDERTGAHHPVAGIWLGTARSNAVAVTLP